MSVPFTWAIIGSFAIFTVGKVTKLPHRTAFADRLIDLGVLLRTDAAYRNLPKHYFTAGWMQALAKGSECSNGILNHGTHEWQTTLLLGAPAFSHCDVYQGAALGETSPIEVAADPAGAASQDTAAPVRKQCSLGRYAVMQYINFRGAVDDLHLWERADMTPRSGVCLSRARASGCRLPFRETGLHLFRCGKARIRSGVHPPFGFLTGHSAPWPPVERTGGLRLGLVRAFEFAGLDALATHDSARF